MRRAAWTRHVPWLLGSALLLGLGLVVFTNSGPDDSHITYWPALTLLRHGAIENYNGQPLEQSSSLLHVLLTAFFARVTGLPVVSVGHTLPILAGLACVPVAYALASRATPRARMAVPLFVATTGCFVHWVFGGLEAPLFALAMLGVAYASAALLAAPSRRRVAWTAAAMTAFAACRPEGVLVLACVGLGMVAVAAIRARRRGTPLTPGSMLPELQLLSAAAVASAIVLGGHLAIGGHPFPNPVRAKAHGLDLGEGIQYLWSNVRWRWSWAFVLFGLAVTRVAQRAPRVSRARGAWEQVPALLTVAYLGFILAVGGDWMWAGRMLAHVAPLLGLLVVAGGYRVARRRVGIALLTLILVLGNYAPLRAIALGSRTGRPFWEISRMRALVHERYPDSRYDWPELASGVSLRDVPVTETLQSVLRRIAPLLPDGEVIVASRQAGFTIYHALAAEHPPVRFIDLHNLATDDSLACGGAYLRRETHGALLPLKLLLHPPAALARACPIVRPHVFFDAARAGEPEEARSSGYTLVFMQRGHPGASNWTEGHSAIFIAVDTTLADQAGLEPVTVEPLDYDEVTTSSLFRNL